MSKSNEPAETLELNSPVDDFIQQECHCCLCGGELTFKHEFDFLNLKVQEASSCPKCHIEVSCKDHLLH